MQYAGNIGGGNSSTLTILEEIKTLKKENQEIKAQLKTIIDTFEGVNVSNSDFDLNDYKTFGMYFAGGATKNCPISGGCAVIVFGLGKIRVAQLAIGPSGTMRVRYYDGGGWSAWGAK